MKGMNKNLNYYSLLQQFSKHKRVVSIHWSNYSDIFALDLIHIPRDPLCIWIGCKLLAIGQFHAKCKPYKIRIQWYHLILIVTSVDSFHLYTNFHEQKISLSNILESYQWFWIEKKKSQKCTWPRIKSHTYNIFVFINICEWFSLDALKSFVLIAFIFISVQMWTLIFHLWNVRSSYENSLNWNKNHELCHNVFFFVIWQLMSIFSRLECGCGAIFILNNYQILWLHVLNTLPSNVPCKLKSSNCIIFSNCVVIVVEVFHVPCVAIVIVVVSSLNTPFWDL